MKQPVIAITMGDPGGIGPEVVIKTLLEHPRSPDCCYVVIGSPAVFSSLHQKTNLGLPFQEISKLEHSVLEKKKVSLLGIGDGKFDIGKETAQNGRAALRAISTAAELANQGLVQAIVTAPLNKAAVRLEKKDFVGHTEFFAKSSGVKQFAMMFVGPKLKLTLATIHVPLKKVSKLLTTKSIFEKILLTHEILKDGFGIQMPRIAVCALNPHGKECGGEEEKVIVPAVEQAQKEGIQVTGPFSADQLFYAAYHGVYDALISMYHDQALGPFKMVHFHDGVNVTLGLPYVRTSPDHGTAYNIAFQGKADPTSMKTALDLAERLVLSRHA